MDRIGRYKIVRELGRGAMGVVYHAIDPNIGRPVAIKTITLGGQRKPEEQERLRERLFREARSAGMLSHPGIVTIYDVEQQDDVAYIAMEYVDGPTLDQLLSSPQSIPPEQMLSILTQTGAALDFAHQKGIVHRDIKPANIMIAEHGVVKITDFGIAKISANEQFTITGAIVGTPHYMSPEQVQGQAVDGRSDQFSLAVVAFEMLTGEKPYTGEHLTTVVYKIVAEEPPPPARLNPTVGGAIEATLRKALSKRPDARYRTCEEFAEAMEKACAQSTGWRTMTRGGTLSAPTLADAGRPAIKLPPARRRHDATSTSERGARQKTGFLPFLMATLVAAGLLALIGWRAAPFLFKNTASKTNGNPPSAAAPEVKQPPATQPAPAPEKANPPDAADSEPEKKPSPMPAAAVKPLEPEQTRPAETTPPRRPLPKRAAVVAQPVTIITSPGGATATLDGRAETACKTPCAIEALPGRHTVSLSMPGHQVERREFDVGSNPVELPAVVLRTTGGTLMLTSVPSGAAVLVNGRRIPQTTPAQIPLAPGTYKITVEKDGKQNSQTVEVRGGLSYLKIPLEQ
jgi:serine/threonine-protein kinase